MVQAICLGIGLVFRLDFEKRNALKLCALPKPSIATWYAAEKLKPIKQPFSAFNSLWHLFFKVLNIHMPSERYKRSCMTQNCLKYSLGLPAVLPITEQLELLLSACRVLLPHYSM